MIKRKVNLFSLPSSRLKRGHERLKVVQKISVGVLILLFILILGNYLYQAKLTGEITTLQTEQENLTNAVTREIPRQRDVNSMVKRLRAIRQALTKDIEFTSSSATLRDIFSSSKFSAKLDEISFSAKNTFNAKITFANQKDMLEFIRISESTEFKKKFISLSVGGFSVSIATESAELHTIDVSGLLL